MFQETETVNRLSFKEFYEATRAPMDTGDYQQFRMIMNRYGTVGEKSHYIQIRQEGRANTENLVSGSYFFSSDTKVQESTTNVYNRVLELEKHLI